MNSDSRVRRLATALLISLALLPVLSFALLGFFARPMRDDFLRIGTYTGLPFREAFQLGLNAFSAGYSFLTVKILLDPLGYTVVQLFPALLLTALLLCKTALLSQGLSAIGLVANRRMTALALGALLLCAVCAGLPSGQSLYYYEAAVKYSLPIALVVLFALLLLHVARQPRAQRTSAAWALSGGLLCFVATGFSETFAIFMLLALTMLATLALLAGGKWRRWLPILASGGCATIAGILVILSAVGLQTRVERRMLRPSIADRSVDEVLAQALGAWFEHIVDPATFASFALMLATGILVGMALPNANVNAMARPGRATRLPQFIVLTSQLLLLPLIWQHQSDQPTFFGRYSAGYFFVIAINAVLILGFAMLLYRSRGGERSRTATTTATCAWLACILLCFAPTQLRDIHWRGYMYLWLSAHILLIMLGWHVSRWLCADHARRFAIGLGSLYILILAGTMAVALATNMLSGKDIARTYTFLAHLFAWLGLVWGLYLGWSLQPAHSLRKMLSASALLVAVWLSATALANNVAMLPHWRQYAAEFDERLSTIIELRATGQREFVFAPFSFDLMNYLGFPSLHEDGYLHIRYNIDRITVTES